MRFQYASDQSLLVSLGDRIALETHHRIRKLIKLLEDQPIPEIRNLHPAYCSLLITFDPCRTTHARLEQTLRARIPGLDTLPLPPSNQVEIPVCYGGEFGPDLPGVARLHGLPPAEIIRIHSSATYHVYFLGFVPGFAYLGGLPDSIATPRLDTPRKRVEPGSVGIAGQQTGVYPFATPGGWRLIGRTPIALFHPGRANMSHLALGDEVRFRPVSPEEYRDSS